MRNLCLALLIAGGFFSVATEAKTSGNAYEDPNGFTIGKPASWIFASKVELAAPENKKKFGPPGKPSEFLVVMGPRREGPVAFAVKDPKLVDISRENLLPESRKLFERLREKGSKFKVVTEPETVQLGDFEAVHFAFSQRFADHQISLHHFWYFVSNDRIFALEANEPPDQTQYEKTFFKIARGLKKSALVAKRTDDLLTTRCEQGKDPLACYQAGTLKGAAGDPEAGFRLFELGCDQKFAPACLEGAKKILDSQGMPEKVAEARAVPLLRKACELKDAVACSTLKDWQTNP